MTHPRVFGLTFALLGAGLILAPRPALAQGVLVAPHYVFIDHRTRSGSLILYNPGNDPVEVTIGTMFGYPVTDSAGGLMLYTPDQPDSTAPSAAGWLEAFPRRTSLGPRERQTVRLLARPPAGLPDGEYWTRLIIDARGGSVPVTGVSDTTQIRVGLTLEVRTILPVYYRKGTLTTGVTVQHVRTEIQGDSLVVRPLLSRTGSGSFIGTVRGALVDSTGRVVSTFTMPLAVYYEVEPRITAPLATVPPGQYRLRLEVASERQDLPASEILPITPVRDSLLVRIP